MGAKCSQLFLENVCQLNQCIQEQQLVTKLSTQNQKTFICTLVKNFKFLGKKYSKIWLTQFLDAGDVNMHLISFIQRVQQQSICPFFNAVLGVGFNCPPEKKETKDAKVLLVQPWLSKPIKGWQLLASQEDIQLLLFQLLYVYYILELGGFKVSIQVDSNMYVREVQTLAETMLYFSRDVFFKAEFPYVLQICHVFKTGASNLPYFVDNYLKMFFSDENLEIVEPVTVSKLLLQVAYALQRKGLLQVQRGGVDPTLFFQTATMSQKNVVEAHFVPVSPTVVTNGVKYRKLLQKQKEVQEELLRYRK